MIRIAIIALSLVFCVPAMQAQTPDTGAEMFQLEGIVTLVNDEPISLYDIRQRTAMLVITLGIQPTPQIFDQLAGTALQQLIDERLQLQTAAEYELTISDEEIAASIERLAAQSGRNRDALEQQFNAIGINTDTLKEQIRADIAWRRIMSGRYGSRIRVSRNAIEEQIELLKAQSQETAYQLSEIFLYAPREEDKSQAFQAAQSLITQLQGGVPFQNAAQQFSSAPTASIGGDMGWITLEDLSPPLAQAVSNQIEAGIIGPVEAEDGVYILALRGRREPQQLTSSVYLKQFVLTNRDSDALNTYMQSIEACADMDVIAEQDEALILVDLGQIKLSDLGENVQALVANLSAGQSSTPFEISRGLAALYVCERQDGIENLPSPDQIEDQLFGRELSMISDRELRNARLNATILQLQ